MAVIILRSSRPAGPIYGLTNAEIDANFKNINDELIGKQPMLISGTTLKTINGASALGSGNLEVTGLPGKDGKDGTNGTNGLNGLSAYQIAIIQGYVGTETQWLASLKGKDGIDGEDGKAFTVDATGLLADRATHNNEPEGFSFLATDESKLYFRTAVANGWSEGIPFGRGEKGDAGSKVVLEKTQTSLVWGYDDNPARNILVPLADITGPQGIQGVPGTNGKQVELQVVSGQIAWRYVGDTAWTNLIAVSSLTGAQGIQGIQGIAGKNIELQYNGTYIQWRLVGDTTWTNLINKADITGPKGDKGDAGTTVWSGITNKPTTLSGFGITNFKADEGLAENINLSTVITSGIYRYNTSSDGPPGVLYSPMLVSRANDTCSQLIFDYGSGVVYSRCGVVRNNTLVMPITESGPPPWRRIANTNEPAKSISNNEINLLAGGNYFVDAVTANKTYSVTNQYPNATFIVELTHTAGAINFPFAIWPNDSPPTLTVNRRHIFEFRLPSTPNAWMVRHLGSYSL